MCLGVWVSRFILFYFSSSLVRLVCAVHSLGWLVVCARREWVSFSIEHIDSVSNDFSASVQDWIEFQFSVCLFVWLDLFSYFFSLRSDNTFSTFPLMLNGLQTFSALIIYSMLNIATISSIRFRRIHFSKTIQQANWITTHDWQDSSIDKKEEEEVTNERRETFQTWNKTRSAFIW